MTRLLGKQLNANGAISRWLAFGAGLLFPLAFAPFYYALVGPAALALLFLLWVSASSKQSAWLGFLFGVGSFGVGVSWVYVSLHNYGNMPALLAVGVTGVFVVILSCYTAAAGFVQAKLRRLPVVMQLTVLMPTLWILTEWLRGWLLTGFPWLYLGYSQIDTPLAGFAPLAGVFGVGFLSAVTAGAGAWFFSAKGAARVVAVGIIMVVVLSGLYAGRIDSVVPTGEPLKVAVIQNNVSLTDKWHHSGAPSIKAGYLKASGSVGDVDLIVWPEAALPEYVDRLMPALMHQLSRYQADFIIGLLERRQQAGRSSVFNSALGVGENIFLYRKQQLVIFGEYLPLRPLLGWLLHHLDIPASDFTSWQDPQEPMYLAGQQVGVTICYEDAFPSLIRRSLPEATMLVNISEDAWFGNSLAPHQRLQMARFRALESARPFVRASNNGLSALIDGYGNVLQQAPQFSAVVLSGELQPSTGSTLYMRYGNDPLLYGLLLMLIAAVVLNYLAGKAKSNIDCDPAP